MVANAPEKKMSRAFSLIELMIVMLIICVLTILSMRQLGGSNRDKLKAGCVKNLQTIYMSMTMYANDNKDKYPVVKDATSSEEPLSVLIPRYTTVTETFICPGSGDRSLPEGESFARRRISYAYYMGYAKTNGPDEALVSDRQVDTNPKRMGQAIFSADGSKPGANHKQYGGNYVTIGGETAHSGPTAKRDFLFDTNVTLLNPR
jgi:prepilin-type N-terminal cleavage/methylation domain-containing protein